MRAQGASRVLVSLVTEVKECDIWYKLWLKSYSLKARQDYCLSHAIRRWWSVYVSPAVNHLTSDLRVLPLLPLWSFSILTCIFSCLLPSDQPLVVATLVGVWFFWWGSTSVIGHVRLQSAASDHQGPACRPEVLQSPLRSTDWVLCACSVLPL